MASAERDPITESRGRAPGQGVKPPEADSILAFEH